MNRILISLSLLIAVSALGQGAYPVRPTGVQASQITGTLPTNTLPGLLSGLSVGDGGGVLTNLKFPQTYWFTNQGATTNWTIPTGARSLLIKAVGAGGPGGSGRRYASGTIASGGGGGAGGSYSEAFIGDVSMLWTNILAIILPSIAQGGGAVTTDDSNGTNGTVQSQTIVCVGYFDYGGTNLLVRAAPGGAGVGGDGDGSAGGTLASIGTHASTAGGSSSATGGAGVAGGTLNTGYGATGGGSGGGITTTPAPSAGGAGGLGPRATIFGSSASGGTIAANGTNFVTGEWRANIASFLLTGWPGAGGGGSSTNSAGGNGADGYGWGSGGGGGGASLNGFASGKGGNGGPSAVSITVY